jgi:hypothetical protein
MNLDNFYTTDNNTLSFTREQASAFAKNMAGDFNPIHDVDARRFCVPGDLLFSVVAAKVGVSSAMRFEFQSMVNENTQVQLPTITAEQQAFTVCDQSDKALMQIERSGASTTDQVFILNFIEQYVRFSGKAFPDILTGLMKQEGVMINPARPLVIYTSMEINIDAFETGALTLDFAGASLDVNGKKGDVVLKFDISVDGTRVGQGNKNMVLGGLRPYEQVVIHKLVEDYNLSKSNYLA